MLDYDSFYSIDHLRISLIAAGIMLTLFKRQLAFNERMKKYFGSNHH